MLVILLLAEILLRVTLGLGTPPLVQADDEIGYLFQAEQDLQRFGNHVYINSYHQRSEELADDEDILRVLFIGDSVTWRGCCSINRKRIRSSSKRPSGPRASARSKR